MLARLSENFLILYPCKIEAFLFYWNEHKDIERQVKMSVNSANLVRDVRGKFRMQNQLITPVPHYMN